MCAAALACLGLAWIVGTTRWVMDADEAVHAVESLRLFDRLSSGDVGGFLVDTYFPERWHPPVNPHVRWYPFVHAWAVLPFTAVLGPSDFSARLPSVVFLFGTALLFFELARRLAAPEDRVAAGLLATFLVLTAPNLLTFSAQSLIATASVFFAFAALLAWLVSLEHGHPRGRALFAGLLLGTAILTKVDHGGVLALAIGVSELVRARFRPRALLRSGAVLPLALAAGMIALWFGHPEKLAALRDSVEHPFYGTPRTILLDFVLTFFVEYASSLVAAACAVVAFFGLWRRRADPGVRLVWIWAAIGVAFYTVRGRFHFRYNIVEAPIFLLAAAIWVPSFVRTRAIRLARSWRSLGVVAVLSVPPGVWFAFSPASFFALLEGPFAALHGLRADHWGMRHPPDEYVALYGELYADFVRYLGASLACAGLGAALLAVRLRPATVPAAAQKLVWLAFGVAAVPTAVGLYVRLPAMVDLELEGHPDIARVHRFVREQTPPDTTVLFGGGWDQLTNNALRWYRATGGTESVALARVPVVGDMIGSVVFPPEPRIAWWAERLATAPLAELPDVLVLLEPDETFLYRTRFGPETRLYRELVLERGAYRRVAATRVPTLGIEVQAWKRAEVASPVAHDEERLSRYGLQSATRSSRKWVGDAGLVLRDESLRHFLRQTRPIP